MIEKILERFREVGNIQFSNYTKPLIAVEDAIQIVQEVAKEYGKDTNVRSNEKKLYQINLNGCDDSTIFEMELTEKEYEFLSMVSELANKTSTYQCMPRLYVEEIAPYQKGE